MKRYQTPLGAEADAKAFERVHARYLSESIIIAGTQFTAEITQGWDGKKRGDEYLDAVKRGYTRDYRPLADLFARALAGVPADDR